MWLSGAVAVRGQGPGVGCYRCALSTGWLLSIVCSLACVIYESVA